MWLWKMLAGSTFVVEYNETMMFLMNKRWPYRKVSTYKTSVYFLRSEYREKNEMCNNVNSGENKALGEMKSLIIRELSTKMVEIL